MEACEKKLNIAVPWTLTHYMPLNGFHPLYKALFENASPKISFHAWDNVKLSKKSRLNISFRKALLAKCEKDKQFFSVSKNSIEKERYESFWYPNIALTKLLQGDIEFHHTAPFPSMTRPFVFHCESFAPIFFPFAHQGTGNFLKNQELREYYKAIFENDLCLGVFSHIQNTLDDINAFFESDIIKNKLFLSRIGLSDYNASATLDINAVVDISEPRFLFINSAHQNPHNFFHRGGHLALRFFKKLYEQGINFKAYMRCKRPFDELLNETGVDIEFVNKISGKNIIWIENYITDLEMNNLLESTHFMLIPSHSLHSVSIMQAMKCGIVPIVTDTVGTSLYVKDNSNGIILRGILKSNWKKNLESRILYDSYKEDAVRDEDLVIQLYEKVISLISNQLSYNSMRRNAIETAKMQFSGQKFADDFWHNICNLISTTNISKNNDDDPFLQEQLNECYATKKTFIQFFASPSQPLTRLYTGDSYIVELGGSFAHVEDQTIIGLHDWSFIAEYINHSPKITFAKSINELAELSLINPSMLKNYKKFLFVQAISKRLDKYPRLKKPVKAIYRKLVKMYMMRKTEVNDVIQGLELCMEGFEEYNILKYKKKYYAILQSDGAFSLNKIKNEVYSSSFIADSLEDIMHQIKQTDTKIHVKYSIVQTISKKLDKYPRLKKPVKAVYRKLIGAK